MKVPNKIICRIIGGLGNQLFCYAAARRLAIVTNTQLVIDDVSGFTVDLAYRRQYQLHHFNISSRKATLVERMEPFSRARRFMKREFNQLLPYKFRSYIRQNGMDFDPRLLDMKPQGNVYLEGYWQSESYFKDVEASVRYDLQIAPPTNIENLKMAEQIRSCLAVAVHVRFFDAPHEIDTNNAPGNYYARAVAAMELLAPNAHYFIFSDRPDDARTKIPLPNRRVTYVTHNQGDENAYADLWLMTQCQHLLLLTAHSAGGGHG
jgi:hypothetical protein